LAGVGVEVEAEAVEAEEGAGYGGFCVVGEERCGGRGGEALELADARVGALPDGQGLAAEFLAENFDAGGAGFGVV